MNFMLSVVPDSFFGVAFGGGGSSSSSCGGGDLGFAVPGFHMIRLLLQGVTLSVPSPWSIEEMAKRMIGWSWWEIQHQAGPLQSRVELFRSGFSKIPFSIAPLPPTLLLGCGGRDLPNELLRSIPAHLEHLVS